MKIKTGLLVAYSLLVVSAKAQLLSLDSVLSRIEKNNPALLAYTSKINSANAMVNSAKMWMPPMVGVQIGENPYSFDFKNNTYNTMIFAEQWIPNGKRIQAKEDYLQSFSSIKQNEYEYLRNQLFSQAKEKYYMRFVTEKKIGILKENISLMKNMIGISEKQMATGMGDLGSIYKMKARLADEETQLVQEENTKQEFTSGMNYLMAADPEQLFLLDTNRLIKNYSGVNYLSAKDSLEKKRSDVQRMNSEIKSMKLNQSLTLMQSKPDYGIKLQHGLMSGNMLMNQYMAMFQMNIPFASWSARGYKSEAKAIGFEITAAEQDKQAMLNEAGNMVNNLLRELHSEFTVVNNYTSTIIPA
ncbi:MAG TPA: TolC family protein, partial [Bacteroidia bacterium]